MITIQPERLNASRSDIERLAEQQWRETGDHGLALNPMWALYEKLETVHALVLLVAREDSRPIGYLAGSVYPHPNSGDHDVGSLPTFFVEQRPGRAIILRSLIAKGVKRAFEMGACKVIVRTDYRHSAGRLLEAMGGEPAAIEYRFAQPLGARDA